MQTPEEKSALNKLLTSKSRNAQMLGLTITVTIFLPGVFRIAGNPDLTVWERLEQLTIELGRTLSAGAVALIPPEAFTDDRKKEPPG